MRTRHLIAAGIFGLLSTLSADFPDAEALIRPEYRLDANAPELGWADLFDRLGASGNIRAEFSESRHLPFRKAPKIFEGHFRRSAEGTVSLAYAETGEGAFAVHVGFDFAYYRAEDGAVKAVPGGSSQRDALMLFPLLVAMRLDPLAETYVFYGTFDGSGGWKLALVERGEREARTDYKRIFLRGAGREVREIVLWKSSKQRIHIRLKTVEYPDAFTPEERARYFFQPPR